MREILALSAADGVGREAEEGPREEGCRVPFL